MCGLRALVVQIVRDDDTCLIVDFGMAERLIPDEVQTLAYV